MKKTNIYALFIFQRLVHNSCVVLQRRRWRGSRRCAPTLWSPARTRLPSGDEASSQRWAVCSNPGNGGRRRVRSSSRPQRVRNTTSTHSDKNIQSARRLFKTSRSCSNWVEPSVGKHWYCNNSHTWPHFKLQVLKK